MSNNFPTAKNNYLATTTLFAAEHWKAHNTYEDKMGIDGSTDVTSLDYLLKNVASVDPGHKHSQASIVGLALPSGAIVGTTDTQTLSGKTLTSPVFQGNVDGWTLANETWAYNSPNGLTVPTGAASKYAVGDRIRWKQGGAYKYGVVVAVADTLLTLAVNIDYTVANAVITDNYYSHQATPLGYPVFFNLTLGYTGFVTNPTSLSSRFSISGRTATVEYIQDALGTSNQTYFTITGLPVAASPAQPVCNYLIPGADASANLVNPVWGRVDTTILYLTTAGSNVWTNSGTKGVYGFVITYGF